MPLDPSIIGGGKPPDIQTPNPLDLITGAAKLQDIQAQVEQRRQAADKARQQAADQADVQRAMAAAGGDVETALPQLYATNPRAAAGFEEAVGKARKEKLEAAGKNLENQGKQADLALQIGRTVGDDGAGYGLARPAMVATSPVLDQILPPADAPWDPARWSQIMQAGVSGKEQIEQKQKVLELFADGKFHAALGNALSQPDITPEKWDQTIQGAITMGMPRAVADEFGGLGGFSPANVANAARLAIPAATRVTEAGQAATRAQTAAHQTVEEQQAAVTAATARGQLAVAQARERREAGTPELVQVMIDGKAVWVPKAQAVGLPAAGGAAGRAPTGAENKMLSYFQRAKDALDTLTTPDATGQTLEDAVSGPALALGRVPWVGNYLLTPDSQKYTEAQRAFTEARLHAETGGRRPPDETYENDRKTYFKQPGDSPAVVAQKVAKRQQVVDGLGVAAGKAYDAYYGAPFTRAAGTAPGGPDLSGLTAGHGRTFHAGPYTGQTWTVGPDGQPKRVS